MLEDPGKQDIFNYRLNSLQRRASEDAIDLCFLEYDDPQNFYPKEKHLEFMLDTAYEYSDITPLPILTDARRRLVGRSAFENYINYLRRSLEVIDTLNNKPVMGIIPPIAWLHMQDLVEFYRDMEINAFVFDLDGKHPISMRQSIRSFLRHLNENDLLEGSFIHGINIHPGRFNKNRPAVEAKDILAFAMGFDSLGERHKPPKAPKDFFEQIKDRKGLKFRLFCKEDYGYHRLDVGDVDSIYPADTSVSRQAFRQEEGTGRIQNTFNIEQLGLEANRLHTVISEHRSLEYLMRKGQLRPQSLNSITQMRTEVTTHQTTL